MCERSHEYGSHTTITYTAMLVFENLHLNIQLQKKAFYWGQDPTKHCVSPQWIAGFLVILGPQGPIRAQISIAFIYTHVFEYKLMYSLQARHYQHAHIVRVCVVSIYNQQKLSFFKTVWEATQHCHVHAHRITQHRQNLQGIWSSSLITPVSASKQCKT